MSWKTWNHIPIRSVRTSGKSKKWKSVVTSYTGNIFSSHNKLYFITVTVIMRKMASSISLLDTVDYSALKIEPPFSSIYKLKSLLALKV